VDITTREVLKATGLSRHSLDIEAEKLGIEPSRRVGIARMWDESAIEKFKAAREADREAQITRISDAL
jgi:hypothetical protein